MKIKIFSHAVDLYNDTSITLEQAKLLETTGLLDAADELNMMLHYNEESFSWLKERWANKSNIKYHSFDISFQPWREYTTTYYMQEYCHNSDEEFYILFIHHKGGFNRTHGNVTWRHYMQYWNIEKWRDCIAKLDEGYDMCGAGFLSNEPHILQESINPYYAGNFYWARSSYIKRCQRLKQPPENGFKTQFGHSHDIRYDVEIWHGSGNPNWFDLHPGPHNRWYSKINSYRLENDKI